MVWLLFTALACTAAPAPKAAESEQARIDRMAPLLQAAAPWMVENGFDVVSRQREQGLRQTLRTLWPGVILSHMVAGTDGLPRGVINARNLYVTVDCISRETHGRIYEFWVARFTGNDWAKSAVKRERFCRFYVTVADRVDGPRRILHEAETFVESYRVDERLTLHAPLEDDLYAWSDLKPWEFPESFPHSELRHWRIGAHDRLGYVRGLVSSAPRVPPALEDDGTVVDAELEQSPAVGAAGPIRGPAWMAGDLELLDRLDGSGRQSAAALAELLGKSEDSNAPLLFAGAGGALRQGRLEDAGFLFYAAYLRSFLDQEAFRLPPERPRFSREALQLRLSGRNEPDLMRNPKVLRAVVKRLEAWAPRIPAGYGPGWTPAAKADEAAAMAGFEFERKNLLNDLGRFATLLEDRNYFFAFSAMPYLATFGSMTRHIGRLPTLEASFLSRFATMERIEKEKGIPGIAAASTNAAERRRRAIGRN